MARIRLIRSYDPRTLLESAAEGFLSVPAARAAEPFAAPPHLLALRQGGLRDSLLALAAERGVPGWFDPPLCLFAQLGTWLGQTSRKPCGDYERLVLLAQLLRSSAPVFARLARADAFVDAIDRLFGELVAEDITPDRFAAALHGRTDRDAFEAARDDDLSTCYAAYTATLERAGRRDGRDGLVDCARAVAADADAFAQRLGGRREIRLFGLQDLRGGWRVLLDALRSSRALDEVRIYTCVGEDALAGLEVDETGWVGERGGLAARLFTDSTPAPPAPAVTLISAPDPAREVDEVAQRVRALVEDGVAPDRIAVVARSARPYTDLVLDALALYGVPATARRRHAFAEIPVVRSVLSLFTVAAEGWTRHGLVELAEQPYFGGTSREPGRARRLDAVVLNHIGYRQRVQGLDAWGDAHRALRAAAVLRELRVERGEDVERRGRDTPPPLHRVESALVAFEAFAREVAPLDSARSLTDWIAWLETFLDRDLWHIESRMYQIPIDHIEVVRIDQAGVRGVRQILGEWRTALNTWGGGDVELDVAAFATQLREMLSGDAALWTPVRRGVLVGEALALAQRAVDHVFLVGLCGEQFPLRARRTGILPEPDLVDLAAAGLPIDVRETWELRERELLRSIVAGSTRSLTCAWARTDALGRELAPSVFLEDIAIPIVGETRAMQLVENDARLDLDSLRADGLAYVHLPGSAVLSDSAPLVSDAAARSAAAHTARIERDRQTGRLSPWNGRIETAAERAWLGERLGDAYVWSATQLESYAKCPWAYFSERLLRLEDLADPEIDIDPMLRGSILHDAMHRFYDLARERTADPVLLREADTAWARDAIGAALEKALESVGSALWPGAPALHRIKRDELHRLLRGYVEWEIEHNEAMHKPGWRANAPKILRTGVVDHELAFGPPFDGAPSGPAEDLVLDLGGELFRVRGSIDRVEIGVDERVEGADRFIAAVDYKSSVYSAPGGGSKDAWDDDVVLQVPLYAHVLERLRPNKRVARVEYRAFKQKKAVHSLELVRLSRDGLVEQPDAQQRMQRALDAVGRHVHRARTGEFPVTPAPSCGCPPFCHAWDICRLPCGPRSGQDAGDNLWKRQLAALRGIPAGVDEEADS